jgi:hypothetical protein
MDAILLSMPPMALPLFVPLIPQDFLFILIPLAFIYPAMILPIPFFHPAKAFPMFIGPPQIWIMFPLNQKSIMRLCIAAFKK